MKFNIKVTEFSSFYSLNSLENHQNLLVLLKIKATPNKPQPREMVTGLLEGASGRSDPGAGSL